MNTVGESEESEKTGKLVRPGKSGIDWYRYNKVRLKSFGLRDLY